MKYIQKYQTKYELCDPKPWGRIGCDPKPWGRIGCKPSDPGPRPR